MGKGNDGAGVKEDLDATDGRCCWEVEVDGRYSERWEDEGGGGE